jgi:ribosomal-protein-alanine N-acetyltransferase
VTGTTLHIPTVETAQLRLRAPVASDFEAYAAFRASERARILGGPNDRAEAFQMFCALVGHWHLRGYGRWIVADRATDEPLGVVGIYHPADWPAAEIGWSVFDAAEGRGIAHEAALATRDYAYSTLGWTTIVSLIRPDNTRSIALARRMGCTIDGQHPHPVYGPLDIWRHRSPAMAKRGAA